MFDVMLSHEEAQLLTYDFVPRTYTEKTVQMTRPASSYHSPKCEKFTIFKTWPIW